MATKERIIELVVSLPDTPEAQLQLDDIEHKLEPVADGPDDLCAMTRRSASRLMKRLTEEEADAGLERW